MLRSGVGRYPEFGHDCRLLMRIFDRNVAPKKPFCQTKTPTEDDHLFNCQLRLLITSGRRWDPQSNIPKPCHGFHQVIVPALTLHHIGM